MSAINFASPSLAVAPSVPQGGKADSAPVHIGKPIDISSESLRLLPYQVPPRGALPGQGSFLGGIDIRPLPYPLPPGGRGIIDCLPGPKLPPDFPKIELPPFPPKEEGPPCGCAPDDTVEYRLGCFGPQSINLDSGRNGPDNINVTIHEDGSSTVTINGCEYNYDADETSRLSIGVDGNDNYHVQDNRSAIDKFLNPMPVKIYAPR